MLKEELSKEDNDNKEYTNKEIEEETIVIKLQIREVDERCSQTEREAVSYTHLDVYKRQFDLLT